MRALIVGLALAITACSVGRVPEDATGAEIYQQLCVNCHAADMSGGIGPDLGPGSNAAGQPDEFLRVSILSGRGRMPSFSSSLDADQVDRLIEHIREVQSG
jgi:mono/diheme cytochrome c family protein